MESKQASWLRPDSWTIGEETDFDPDSLFLPIICNGHEIALVHTEADEERGKANAALIAAAPEIAYTAEALLEVIGHVTGIEPQRKALIAALKKGLGHANT